MYILWFIFFFLYIQCACFRAVSINAPFTLSREEVVVFCDFQTWLAFRHTKWYIESINSFYSFLVEILTHHKLPFLYVCRAMKLYLPALWFRRDLSMRALHTSSAYQLLFWIVKKYCFFKGFSHRCGVPHKIAESVSPSVCRHEMIRE
jgi:hypothetical protein